MHSIKRIVLALILGLTFLSSTGRSLLGSIALANDNGSTKAGGVGGGSGATCD